MYVSLTPELERLVQEKVSSGVYQTANEVIREGLRLLHERDQQGDALRRSIIDGFAEIEQGEFEEYEESAIGKLAEDVKLRGRTRLAELRKRSSE